MRNLARHFSQLLASRRYPSSDAAPLSGLLSVSSRWPSGSSSFARGGPMVFLPAPFADPSTTQGPLALPFLSSTAAVQLPSSPPPISTSTKLVVLLAGQWGKRQPRVPRRQKEEEGASPPLPARCPSRHGGPSHVRQLHARLPTVLQLWALRALPSRMPQPADVLSLQGLRPPRGALPGPTTTRKMLIDRSLPVVFVYDPTLLVVSSSAGLKERYWYLLAAALVI